MTVTVECSLPPFSFVNCDVAFTQKNNCDVAFTQKNNTLYKGIYWKFNFTDIIIIIIIFIETRLQDTIVKIIKYRWLG